MLSDYVLQRSFIPDVLNYIIQSIGLCLNGLSLLFIPDVLNYIIQSIGLCLKGLSFLFIPDDLRATYGKSFPFKHYAGMDN